jgi:alpha-L-rhamnosidase
MAIPLFPANALADLRAVNLRCGGWENPVGVDSGGLELSWNLASDHRGERQVAYQVLVASSAELLGQGKGDLWDSGKVQSDQSLHVPYAGRALQPRQTCFWKVRVYGSGNSGTGDAGSQWSASATWTLGLLENSDWKGEWISASKWFMPPKYRPPGFMTLAQGNAEYLSWAQVDLGQRLPIDSVKLFSQHPDSFPLRFRIEAADDFDFRQPRIIADCSDHDFHGPANGVIEFPGKQITASRVRLVILKSPPIKAGAKTFQSVVRQMEVWSGGQNVALMRPTRESGRAWDHGHATFMFDGMPSANEGDTCPDDACPTVAAPMLRKSFVLDKPVKRALLSYAALGMADVSINGKKIGDAVLDPPFTDATKRVIDRMFDVTAELASGENVIGAVLGNGFFSTPGRGFGERMNGDGQPRLLAQLDIQFTDGSKQTITSDQSWRWDRSEITLNDVWQGYEEDRRLAQPGWDRPGFDASHWRAVGIWPGLGGKLTAALGPTVRVVAQLKPARVEGDTAYFDVLSAGWPRLIVNGHAGQTIEVRGDSGMHPQRYTLASDGKAVLEPRFVFFSGPKKLQVIGLDGPLSADAVCMQQVRGDFQLTSEFKCSNDYFNQLHDVVLRTHTNYDLEHPQDPMREKQGWTQDAQNMFDTAAYLSDVQGLYRKWWWDMADNQNPNGLLGSVVPLVGRQVDDWNCPWWSGMIVWLPWEHYLYYGDRRVLEDAFEPMKRYVDYLDHIASIGAGQRALDYPNEDSFLDPAAAARRLLIWTGAGDWQNPRKKVPGPLMNMTGWYYYASIVSKTASLLGKQDDTAHYAAMAQDVAQRCDQEYLNLNTGLYGADPGGQTAQVMPLQMGMVPDKIRPLTTQRLIDAIHLAGDHHETGFVALPYLLQFLTENNLGALANRIVNQKTYPSWKTLMHDGVLAEGWNGGGAQMPSCGGAVGMWLYQSVLGICPDPAGPGFKRFLIAPQPDPATGLTWAEGWYDSIQGRIESKWRLANGEISMEVEVPTNTIATIRIPSARPGEVREGGKLVTESDGVKVLGSDGGALRVEVGGGQYEFVGPQPEFSK